MSPGMDYSDRKRFADVLRAYLDRAYGRKPGGQLDERADRLYDLVEAWVRGEAHTLSDEEITDLEKLILRVTGLD